MRALLLLPVALLAGCAAGPVARAPQRLAPPAYHHAPTTVPPADLTHWWTAFQDATLTSLLERAARNSPDVRAAAARVLEARAARGVARAALLPSVGQTTNLTRLRGGFAQGVVRAGGAPGAPPSGSFVSPFDTGLLQAGVDVRWEADLFGGLRSSARAAAADERAAEWARRDVMVTLLADLARAYMDLRGSQRQWAIAARARDAQRDTLDLTRVRRDAGLATSLDVERQSALLAETEAALPGLHAASLVAAHRIAVLAGEEPGAELATLQPPGAWPAAPDVVGPGLPSTLLQRRPDVRRAEADIAAATARVGVARSDLFPKLVLSGLTGRQTTSPAGITLGAGNFFSVGPGVQLPLFTGGRVRAQIAVQDARLQQAVAAYEQEVLAALEETENALALRAAERERRDRLAAAVRASGEALALSQELYAKGLADFLSVLDAQRSLYGAEDALARSETDLLRQTVALYRALGGGWEP